MELKLNSFKNLSSSFRCLNRTFYGIETHALDNKDHNMPVLIVPFMELKHQMKDRLRAIDERLVLIVPFMELKLMGFC